LELASYYCKFIPGLADLTAVLTSATAARAPDAVGSSLSLAIYKTDSPTTEYKLRINGSVLNRCK